MKVEVAVVVPNYSSKKSREFSIVPQYSQSYPFIQGLEERGIRVSTLDGGEVKLDGREISDWWRGYLSVPKLIRIINKHRIVFIWSTLGVMLSALSELPFLNFLKDKIILVLFYNHNPNHNLLKKILLDKLMYFGLKNCKAALYMLEKHIKEAKSIYALDDKKIVYCPAGVDVVFFKPKSEILDKEKEYGVSEQILEFVKKPYIVVSGDQLRSESDIIEVLDGLNFSLVRLTQNTHIEYFWKNKKPSFPVFCVSHLNPFEVRYLYQNAFCCLNLVDNSWQPAGWTAITEAMACGLPVIMNSGLVTEEINRLSFTKKPFIEVNGFSSANIKEKIYTLVKDAE
ncbi:MAG: hypothetical protein WC784_05575, partial [Candidatus Shapirobacteria bacterium]